jgi:hypothetical protein
MDGDLVTYREMNAKAARNDQKKKTDTSVLEKGGQDPFLRV